MLLTNDCLDCLNAFEDTVFDERGRVHKVMKCEYQHATFPHAVNCATCQPEVCNVTPLDAMDLRYCEED